MRALLITVGSRGDCEPFCALAQQLLAKGHQVDLFLQTDAKHMAPAGASVHELPFTQTDFYRFVGKPSHGADDPNPRIRFVGVVADCIGELVLPCRGQVLSVAKDASVIVCSSLARNLALLARDVHRTPVWMVNLQPLVPTKDFPHYSDTKACLEALLTETKGSEANFEYYVKLERVQFEFLHERLAACYEELKVPMRSFQQMEDAICGRADAVHVVSSFALVPPISDAEPNVRHVGPLADGYVPSTWQAPEGLTQFLEMCGEKRPLCVGYGSMPFDKAEIVLKALRRAGEKAVLVGDALKTPDSDSSADVFQIPSAPYAWLLPRCSMMLSHGGAGVVNATLRAGAVPVISPLMGDQFFWAQLLEAKGLGVQAGTMNDLTEEDLVQAIAKGAACQTAAQQLGEAIRSKPAGVEVLSQMLAEAHG